MKEDALLVSLGHNSSAIYTNGQAAIGYEQERLDRVKSSSKPPLQALFQIERECGVPAETPVYVTHWFDHFGNYLPESKYSNIGGYVTNKESEIISHSAEFTHHDAHAYSVYSFYKYHLPTARLSPYSDWAHIIVADGFGNYQEVISIYKVNIKTFSNPELVQRIYGFENSMGLMYQYATHFCGMKMNQDEYKFLGYESRILYQLSQETINWLKAEADRFSDRLYRSMLLPSNQYYRPQVGDQLIDYEHLGAVERLWCSHFADILNHVCCTNRESFDARVIIGFYIQRVIENILGKFVEAHCVDNLLVAGGIFYNVKLNNSLLKSTYGHFCAVPLAGDQGAAIGFYDHAGYEFDWSTLCIGERGLYKHPGGLQTLANEDRNIYVPETREEALGLLESKLMAGEICNLIGPKMEYGPRALCSTSSLFLPTQKNSELNNSLNKRNEVMPFAPVITDYNLYQLFQPEQFTRVVGSDKYMIVTYDYSIPPTDLTLGVYHNYPDVGTYSGRPQVVTPASDGFMSELLTTLDLQHGVKMLTNTSYNYHGEPIVFSVQDIIATHNKQMLNGEELGVKPNLIIFSQKS